MNVKNNNISLVKILFILITFIVLLISFFAIRLFSNYADKNFSDYAKNTAENIAYQASSFDIYPNDDKITILKTIAKSSLHNDSNIMMIEFLDSNGSVFITEKSNLYNPQKFYGLKINTPINSLKSNTIETIGYIKISISNENFIKQIKIQKIFLIIFFVIIWLSILILVLVYKLILDRELKILYLGLQHILDGKFGTKINIIGNKQTQSLIQIFNDLSYKLKIYEEQNVENILLERNKFEAILMSIVNGVVVCDNTDSIVLINSAAEKMMNVTAENVIGVEIQCYSDFKGNYCFKEKIEEFKDIPLENILKNPPEFTVTIDKKIIKCIISPIFMQNEDYVGYIIVMLDITKETEVNNMKNQFISNVSHELRTPVTVLRTYIDTLYTMFDELDEETRREFTATANKEVTRLHRMVNDILDVSRLESPDVKLEKENAEITKIIEETISSMQVLANEKNVQIVFIKQVEEIKIPVNVANIERVFNNLISNAIKYSPENTTIEIELKNKDGYIDISVTDHGCGIEEKHLEKLFDRFYRVENSVHTVKGTGLGLYLVKTTVEKHHGGKVYVTSKVGEGSTFGIKLPKKDESL